MDILHFQLAVYWCNNKERHGTAAQVLSSDHSAVPLLVLGMKDDSKQTLVSLHFNTYVPKLTR
jgi:hypothetical protein